MMIYAIKMIAKKGKNIIVRKGLGNEEVINMGVGSGG